MTNPKDTPLEAEKKQKAQDILDADAAAKQTPETKAKPTLKKRGRKPGQKNKAKKPDPEPYNLEEGLKQGMFFLEMMNNIRKSMGITKPIDELTANAFVQSIPAMEMKYGAAVSKYMPEMMFFGSSTMIMLDTVKELRIVKAAQEKKPDKAKNGKNKSD